MYRVIVARLASIDEVSYYIIIYSYLQWYSMLDGYIENNIELCPPRFLDMWL